MIPEFSFSFYSNWTKYLNCQIGNSNITCRIKVLKFSLGSYLSAETTKESVPKMAQCKCKVFVEEVAKKFAHSEIRE